MEIQPNVLQIDSWINGAEKHHIIMVADTKKA